MNEHVVERGSPGPHPGELAGTAGIFALAALLLGLLVASLDGGLEGEAGRGTPAPRTEPAADYRAPAAPAGLPILVIVLGEERATEVEELLVKEGGLRALLGEPAREAEVISAADAAAAEAIRAAVFDQSAIPGTRPMHAVVVAER